MLAASSHASTSALATAAAAVKESAPASPFAQLLRNSRFATYDPLIRKTYYSPKQFVERGYWGLKRPITQRKKNSFITITQWETRQHYAEWDNAEDQVRFIRRMEELDVRPVQRGDSTWFKQLGPARENWLVDSEFCPHVWEPVEKPEVAEQVPKPRQQDIPLTSLGDRGAGGYGRFSDLKRATQGGRKTPSAVIPNIEAMPPHQFKRYLKKLRTLRPAFIEYLERETKRQEAEKKRVEEQKAQNPPTSVAEFAEPELNGRTVLQVAQYKNGPFHRLFLAHLTESEYKSTSKIQPQVHRNGALIYSHPSMLGPLFYTKPKPGIVLQWEDSGRFTADKPQLLAAFAGVTAVLDPHDGEGLEPLMKEGSVDREMWPLAVAEFRPITKDALSLRAVPRVVGRDLDEGLSGVYMELDVSADRDKPSRENPYFPGTREYIALEGADLEDLEKPRGGSSRTAADSAPAPTPPLRSLKNSPIAVGIQAQSSLYSITSNQQIQTNKETLSVLQNLLSSSGTRKADDKVGDQEL